MKIPKFAVSPCDTGREICRLMRGWMSGTFCETFAFWWLKTVFANKRCKLVFILQTGADAKFTFLLLSQSLSEWRTRALGVYFFFGGKSATGASEYFLCWVVGGMRFFHLHDFSHDAVSSTERWKGPEGEKETYVNYFIKIEILCTKKMNRETWCQGLGFQKRFSGIAEKRQPWSADTFFRDETEDVSESVVKYYKEILPYCITLCSVYLIWRWWYEDITHYITLVQTFCTSSSLSRCSIRIWSCLLSISDIIIILSQTHSMSDCTMLYHNLVKDPSIIK